MCPSKSPFFTLIILAVFASIFSGHKCQICNLEHGNLPQDWRCDGTPHVLNKNSDKINSYCGYNISSSLTEKIIEKVANGRPALLGELPFVAAIGFKGRHLCGAALIDNYHLVTAAHCVLWKKHDHPNGKGINPKELTVQMGTTFRYGTLAAERDTNRTVRDVFQKYIHRYYEQGYVDQQTKEPKKGGFGGYDITVLTLVDPMPFTRNIWPICIGGFWLNLAFGIANHRTSPLILSGFGQDQNNPVVQLQLSKDIRLLPEDKCEEAIEDHLHYEFQTGIQICTVGAKEEKTTGACPGDSGSALSIVSGARHYLLGVLSYGPANCVEGSTTNPDVYTQTSQVIGWINDITTKWKYSQYYERSKFHSRTIT